MGILPYPASSLWTAAPNAIEKFLGAHPAALKFVQTPKPIPTSFGKESLFAVSAFKFTNADGVSRYGRYRVLPVGGNEYLDEAAAAARSQNCLFDEIKERVAKEPVKFHIVVQLAEDGDTVDDATVRWPEDRPQLTFGEISLRETTPNNASEQQRIIFDPIPRVDGIEASADPLLREDSRESRFPASPSGSWCLINQLPREDGLRGSKSRGRSISTRRAGSWSKVCIRSFTWCRLGHLPQPGHSTNCNRLILNNLHHRLQYY